MYRNIILTIVAVCCVSVLLGVTILTAPKIGIVRSADLISHNDMMQDEIGRWHNMESELKMRIVSLENEVKQLRQRADSTGGAVRAQTISLLDDKQRALIESGNELQGKMAQREGEIMNAVLSRINAVAQNYGEEHGFDIILGSSGDGNILYGRETIDITDEVMEALNREYQDVK